MKTLTRDVPTRDEIKDGHRRKQIAILANAMDEHGLEFTEYDMQKIGYAVFAAVGCVIVQGRHPR